MGSSSGQLAQEDSLLVLRSQEVVPGLFVPFLRSRLLARLHRASA